MVKFERLVLNRFPIEIEDDTQIISKKTPVNLFFQLWLR